MSQTTGRENSVEEAIVHSLNVYCSEQNAKINSIRPYANQQNSEKLNQYCADLIHVLNDCGLLLLEVKELIGARLPRFEEDQHSRLLRLESWLPVRYAYNAVPRQALPNWNQRPKWAAETLKQIYTSIPTDLPDATPNQQGHLSLLDLVASLLDGRGEPPETARKDRFHQFGLLLDQTIMPDLLTNWFLILVYQGDRLFFMTGDDLITIYTHLSSLAAQPTNAQLANATQLLHANPFRQDVIDALSAPPDDSNSPSDDNGYDNGAKPGGGSTCGI